jgi:hypothetical protein
MSFFIIANNQVFGVKDTLAAACVVVFYEITSRNGTDIVFEILEQDDSDQVWFHFNAHHECVHTVSNRVVWSP